MKAVGFVAFDIELAELYQGELMGLQSRPKISCVTTAKWPASTDADEVESGFEVKRWADTDDIGYTDFMSKKYAGSVVDYLTSQLDAGFIPVTFNGVGFDIPVLAWGSEKLDDCKRLARDGVDMMYDFVAQLGFPCSLSNSAKAIGVDKTDGWDGVMAVDEWKKGNREPVIEYCLQDTIITAQVFMKACKTGDYAWIKGNGKPGKMTGSLTYQMRKAGHKPTPADYVLIPIEGGSDWPFAFRFLNTVEAMALPYKPDTSWMDSPPKFTPEGLAMWLTGGIWWTDVAPAYDDAVVNFAKDTLGADVIGVSPVDDSTHPALTADEQWDKDRYIDPPKGTDKLGKIVSLVDAAAMLIDEGGKVRNGVPGPLTYSMVQRDSGEYAITTLEPYSDPTWLPLGEVVGRAEYTLKPGAIWEILAQIDPLLVTSVEHGIVSRLTERLKSAGFGADVIECLHNLSKGEGATTSPLEDSPANDTVTDADLQALIDSL